MSLNNQVVLVIDDDADARVLIQKILANVGMRVETADNADAALQAISRNEHHLIITDLHMPRKDGFALLEELQATKKLKNKPVLVLSALMDKNSVYRALSLGASDYLVKPIHSAALLQRVRKLLHDRKFLKHTFDDSALPKAFASVAGQITRISEASLVIESSVKISSETEVFVDSKLLASLDLQQTPLRTTLESGVLARPGRYKNPITLVGINETSASKIRKMVRSW